MVGLTATQLRDELSVYTKAQVDSLLAGKANVGHTHGISLYSGTAGDPPHEHLVQGTLDHRQHKFTHQLDVFHPAQLPSTKNSVFKQISLKTTC